MRLVDGVPASLNRALATGRVDLAPVSAFAYLQHATEWVLLRGLAIASSGAARSVFLCEASGGDPAILQVPRASATAAAMAELLERWAGRPPKRLIRYTRLPQSGRFLVFGDTALRLGWRPSRRVRVLYDVGSEWKKRTGCVCVFAVFAVRREIVRQRRSELRTLAEALRKSVARARREAAAVARETAARAGVPAAIQRAYYAGLRFGLSRSDVRGLRRLQSEALRAGWLPQRSPIKFAEDV